MCLILSFFKIVYDKVFYTLYYISNRELSKKVDGFILPGEYEHEAFQKITFFKTRPATQLPKWREGRQGPYLRSLAHLGRSSGVKKIKS